MIRARLSSQHRRGRPRPVCHRMGSDGQIGEVSYPTDGRRQTTGWVVSIRPDPPDSRPAGDGQGSGAAEGLEVDTVHWTGHPGMVQGWGLVNDQFSPRKVCHGRMIYEPIEGFCPADTPLGGCP